MLLWPCLCADGLGGYLAVCGGTERGPWPRHRRGFLYDDRHLPHTEVQFSIPSAQIWCNLSCALAKFCIERNVMSI